MNEKIIVEFDVEKTFEREFGYQEKLLRFRGSDTKYKGIVKNGVLISIVGRNYKLLPNELLHARIVELCERNGWLLESVVKQGWRWYWFIRVKNDAGVVVANSVDGSEALKVTAYMDHKWFIGSKLMSVYRRHVGSVSYINIGTAIKEVANAVDEFREWLMKLDEIDASSHLDVFEALASEIPKKYVEKPISSAKLGKKLSGERFTVKDFYEAVAVALWSADVDIRTKARLYRKLNEAMLLIVEFGGDSR